MMKTQSTGGMKTVARQSQLRRHEYVCFLKYLSLLFVFTPGLAFHSRAVAQSTSVSPEGFRVAFTDAPRNVRNPAPLVQEVEALEMGAWNPPPELLRHPGDARQSLLDHPAIQTSPSADDSTLPWVSQDRATARNYAAVNYIPGIKPIGEIDISINPKAKESDTTVPRKAVTVDDSVKQYSNNGSLPFSSKDFWVEPKREMVAYQPLYFEEVNLERYGRSLPGQPFLSIGRFFGTLPTLPYQMAVYPPRKPYYWNWTYRAGWGAPRVRELPPFRWDALSIEAVSLTGAAALIP